MRNLSRHGHTVDRPEAMRHTQLRVNRTLTPCDAPRASNLNGLNLLAISHQHARPLFFDFLGIQEVQFITCILFMYYISNIYYSRGGLTEGEEVEVNEREGRRANARSCY